MIFLYSLGLSFLALLALPFVPFIFLYSPKLSAGFFQKLGFYKSKKNTDNTTQTILIHAVSVGEVNAIENFVKKLSSTSPNYKIILTTTTKTGQEVANNKLKDFTTEILYFPYDFAFSVNKFLNFTEPDKIIIAETEIWPNFSKYAAKRNIPIFILNGRISPNSHKGYKKISFFLKEVFKNYTKIMMQTESDVERIISIGAPPSKVSIMGNLKFDIEKSLNGSEIEQLRTKMGLTNEKLFVAASTHSGEDEIAIETFLEAKKNEPSLKLLIAPRHPQRYEQVENLIKTTNLSYGKRSNDNNFENNDIIMLDTMGELAKLYSLAYIAFIGGSFSNTGGHNPLEANIWGVPVISGDTVFNFKDIYKTLTQMKAAVIVHSQKQFTDFLIKFLQDKNFYDEAVNGTKKIFEISKGALDKAFNEIF